ncbi:hypothetical protein NPIL_475201 [Nephila pilipes]|uniref:Uncharacterized protein n=1 Tax=Nephila pilipes TaxID=299642 RepID=A0A8X6P6T4_NEPPI|nr:hypothetical protein NPIL_475201 [Nephila pilipes]
MCKALSLLKLSLDETVEYVTISEGRYKASIVNFFKEWSNDKYWEVISLQTATLSKNSGLVWKVRGFSMALIRQFQILGIHRFIEIKMFFTPKDVPWPVAIDFYSGKKSQQKPRIKFLRVLQKILKIEEKELEHWIQALFMEWTF